MTLDSKIRPIIYRQFPIRLDERTMAELDRLAIQTRVPKTQLARDAMLVMMTKLKKTGAAEQMNEVLSAWVLRITNRTNWSQTLLLIFLQSDTYDLRQAATSQDDHPDAPEPAAGAVRQFARQRQHESSDDSVTEVPKQEQRLHAHRSAEITKEAGDDRRMKEQHQVLEGYIWWGIGDDIKHIPFKKFKQKIKFWHKNWTQLFQEKILTIWSYALE